MIGLGASSVSSPCFSHLVASISSFWTLASTDDEILLDNKSIQQDYALPSDAPSFVSDEQGRFSRYIETQGILGSISASMHPSSSVYKSPPFRARKCAYDGSLNPRTSLRAMSSELELAGGLHNGKDSKYLPYGNFQGGISEARQSEFQPSHQK